MSENITQKIKLLVMEMGIPVNIIGYTYIVESLKYMFEENHRYIFLNEIYTRISKNYNTSEECIDVSIRNGIKKSKINKTAKFKKLFKFCDYAPSNSVFLNTLNCLKWRKSIFLDLEKLDARIAPEAKPN